MLLWISSSIIVIVTFILFCRQPDPRPINGVYKQPGKWYHLKYIVFLVIFQLRKWQNSRGMKAGKSQAGYGVQSHSTFTQMDVAQPLSSHPKAFDAVFFIAANRDGYYFIAGSERRHRGVVNGLCYLAVPGKGLLCSPKLPDTVLFGASNGQFGAEGLLLKPANPMKKWKITYNGKMWLQSDPSQVFDVKVEGDWTSELPYFNYDTDLHPTTVARAIARETWSRSYFKTLQKAHQTHYEQMGVLKASFQLNGEVHQVTLPSFRDHSYGNKRDWNLMHRYAFFMFFLEDGTKATIGVICQPCTCSRLEAGYVYSPTGKVESLEWCDFELYEHGENGIPPKDHGFSFKAGGKLYDVQVNVEYESTHYVGWNWEARMVERFVRYVVNGIPGQGVSEFHYHNKKGRPPSVTEKDPQWFRKLMLK